MRKLLGYLLFLGLFAYMLIHDVLGVQWPYSYLLLASGGLGIAFIAEKSRTQFCLGLLLCLATLIAGTFHLHVHPRGAWPLFNLVAFAAFIYGVWLIDRWEARMRSKHPN